MEREEPVHGPQPFGDALGVVHALDAEQHGHVADAEAPAQPPLLAPVFFRRRGRGAVEVDADRLRPHQRGLAAARDGGTVHLDARLQGAVHRLQEVHAVILDVKRQNIIAEEAVEDLFLPRADAEHLAVGPRDVPEVEDDQVRPGLAEHPRQQGEVVVLHEDHGRLAVHLFQHGVGELAVDAAVMLPVGGVEARGGAGDVAQRPQGVVGEAVVVALLLLACVNQTRRRVYVGFSGGHGRCGRGRRWLRGRRRRLPCAHPDAAAGPHDGVEGGGHAAGRPAETDLVAVVKMDVRLSVGDDDELGVAEARAGDFLQPFFRPGHGVLQCGGGDFPSGRRRDRPRVHGDNARPERNRNDPTGAEALKGKLTQVLCRRIWHGACRNGVSGRLS